MSDPGRSAPTKEALRAAGRRLGFTQVGFAPGDPPAHATALLTWLDAGMHGEMEWMARPDSVRRRLDPAEALPGCATVVMVSMSYAPEPVSPDGRQLRPGDSVVARYAHGRDYHLVFEERLARLAEALRELIPGAETKAYVDYGPVMERDHAQRAGLGWIGKNTMLIHPELGSWLLLGVLLTTASLPPDDAFTADRCGTCTRCIEACPTNAITPRRVDSRLCISYLTIELRGAIPVHLRSAIGNRVFGCDICQEVCPWNDAPPTGDAAAFRLGAPVAARTMSTWTEELLDMSPPEFRRRYADSPLSRPGRDGLLRNLCVGLGNSGEEIAAQPLMKCLDEESPIVREHAAWGLGRLAEAREK